MLKGRLLYSKTWATALCYPCLSVGSHPWSTALGCLGHCVASLTEFFDCLERYHLDSFAVGEQLTEQRATQTSSQAELDPISRSAAADASDARLDQNAADLTEQSLERGPNTDATPGPTGSARVTKQHLSCTD